ncbi:hypothetical protein BDV32DRAFT_19299 [Aspergillus pseudonomiae]|nr:hypothetical protein BDV32DRAFT_19299 [Aspergillus pseudonomiae]
MRLNRYVGVHDHWPLTPFQSVSAPGAVSEHLVCPGALIDVWGSHSGCSRETTGSSQNNATVIHLHDYVSHNRSSPRSALTSAECSQWTSRTEERSSGSKLTPLFYRSLDANGGCSGGLRNEANLFCDQCICKSEAPSASDSHSFVRPFDALQCRQGSSHLRILSLCAIRGICRLFRRFQTKLNIC